MDYQIVWYWRAFFWPFYFCKCEEHGRHLTADNWRLGFFVRYTPEWSLFVVYKWVLRVGPLEIRRWAPDPDMPDRIRAHNEAVR